VALELAEMEDIEDVVAADRNPRREVQATLDSERARFSAELDESTTLQRYLNAIVELYKALGGGWSPAP
jgi:outer membrane protein TolC